MCVSVQVEGWAGGYEAARGEDCMLVGSVDAVEFLRASEGGRPVVVHGYGGEVEDERVATSLSVWRGWRVMVLWMERLGKVRGKFCDLWE